MAEILVRAKFAAPLDAAAVAADWRARGYSCGTFVDPPGRRWEGFVHDCTWRERRPLITKTPQGDPRG